VLELETQIKAESSLAEGSSRKMFMTTPTVLKEEREEKVGEAVFIPIGFS
jgi:hypothetical protein